LKIQFSQEEGDLDLQEIPKLVLIPKKRAALRKKVVVVKDKNEEVDKTKKIGWKEEGDCGERQR
jgi:hypothetical protein